MARQYIHHLPIKELDLSNLAYNNTVVDRTLNAVPGLKTSAAFFTFLRANLVLPPSTLNSTTSTPLLDPLNSQTLPPLPPSSLAYMMSLDDEIPSVAPNPLDAIPALTTDVLTTESDRVSALKLVADSVAQQRQLASRAVIFHPITLAAYSCLLALTHRYLYKSSDDLGVLLTTFAGLTMACLVGVRSLTAGYISAAEEMNWSFVQNEEGEDDIIIGSRYGDDIIGALILRLERNGNYSPQRRKAKKGKTGGKGVVRAWTTKLRYRGTGIGRDLLEHTVKLTRDRLGNSAEIGFAAQHANSKMILPEMFNGGFRKTERQAARALDAVAGGSGSRD